jgi:CBS domain-containing protein
METRVADIMTVNIRAIGPDETVGEAVRTLIDAGITGLPVVDSGRHLIGVLSSTDVLAALAESDDADARRRIFDHTRVEELMTRRVRSVGSQDNVIDAAEQMLYLEVHRLFVVDDDVLVGVVTASDITRSVALRKV